MRLVPTRSTRSHAPFAGAGASLYIGSGNPDPGAASVLFRNLRAWPAGGHFTAGAGSKIGAANTLKTARVASVADPTATIDYALPGSLANQIVYAQVRTYKDNVENESNFRPARITLDGSLADATGINGTARLLRLEQRDGGVVRIRFQYFPAVTGKQPVDFRATRTAGPSSPADVTVLYAPPQQIYEIDTPALLDSAPYTYSIIAENGATTLALLTGIAVQADATGPVAPAVPTAAPW